MQIIQSFPPNFATIYRVLPGAANPGVVFSYAPDVYCMQGTDIHPAIIAHEKVHLARQAAMGVDEWWARYLIDLEWRYNEELLGHRAEYQWHMEHSSRPVRRAALKQIAKRLSGPLYGKVIKLDRAMEDIAA